MDCAAQGLEGLGGMVAGVGVDGGEGDLGVGGELGCLVVADPP
jgi:hypothetical protein